MISVLFGTLTPQYRRTFCLESESGSIKNEVGW